MNFITALAILTVTFVVAGGLSEFTQEESVARKHVVTWLGCSLIAQMIWAVIMMGGTERPETAPLPDGIWWLLATMFITAALFISAANSRERSRTK